MAGTLSQDLRSGLRILKKSPGFTIVAILSLALGIGANTAIFTIINAVFLHPLPVQDPAQLVEMYTRDTKTIDANTGFQLTPTSLPNYEDYRDQNTVFSGLAAATFPLPVNWGGQSEPQQLQVSLVSPNFFDVLGVKAYRGKDVFPQRRQANWRRRAHVYRHCGSSEGRRLLGVLCSRATRDAHRSD